MATLKDIAKEVGVSVATVSYVLNNTGSVGDAMTKQVLAAVKKLNYTPNRRAQAMRTGLSKSIGLVLPDLTNPYFPELAQKVEDEARQRGVAVVLIDSQNNIDAENQGLSILAQQSVDGIIWCPVSNVTLEKKAAINCPIVLIDRPSHGFDVVHANYRAGGALAAEHAIKLGHKKVGLLSGPQDIEGAVQRRNGFIERAKKDLEIVWDVEVPFTTELNAAALKALSSREATFIFAADDLIAIGAINALMDMGMNVPQDVSVIGFDNIPWSLMVRPKLTTISQPIADIGKVAVDILSQRIKSPDKIVCSIILDVNLVVRNSTKSIL
jgi:LacI family transcriptional regulator